MMKTLIVAARDRGRMAEIVQVVSRFGLDVLLARWGLGSTEERSTEEAWSLPRRTRLALEELGPTFVKLGQIAATRGDLLPPEWTIELQELHSGAPTLPFEDLRPAVEDALGQAPEVAFAGFDPVPIAAASVAQVHRASLADGREVVLKIRRPGIKPRMEADLRLIAQFARAAEAASADARRFAPSELVRQLAEAVLEELDFTMEARNAERLGCDFADDPRVVVPRVHWEWTSETLLVMDYVEGVPPRDGQDLRSAGIDPAAIATLGADIVLDMVLLHGRFHADPHPGNLLCLAGNRIALLDLGMLGHVSLRRQDELVAFVLSLTTGDAEQLADVLVAWSPNDASRRRTLAVAERLLTKHGDGRLLLNAVVADFMQIMRQEAMTLPPDLLLIFKALVTIDGVLAAIMPDFDLSDAMRRSSVRVMKARLSPDRWGPVLHSLTWELGRLGEDAPRLVRALVRRLEQDPVNNRADHNAAIVSSARWIAAAIFLSAILISGVLFLA